MEIIAVIIIILIFIFIWSENRYQKVEEPEQITFIYCKCGNEMCSDGSFISDTYDDNGDNHVLYKCKKCGKETDYNFDIAPVPISWEEIKCQSE